MNSLIASPTSEHDQQPWMAMIPQRDREVTKAAGYGSPQGFGIRPAILVVDVNYGFTGRRPAPILEAIAEMRTSCGAAAWEAVAAIEVLLAKARARGVPVFYTTNHVPADVAQMGQWAAKNARVAEDTVEGSARAQIVSEIAPHPGDVVFSKSKPSAFVGTDLIATLVGRQIDTLLVVGGSTSGCVRATVVDGFSYNFRMTMVADGCFDRSEISHAVTLFDMDAKYADVISLSDAVAFLEGIQKGVVGGA